jgi:hypothetical protein
MAPLKFCMKIISRNFIATPCVVFCRSAFSYLVFISHAFSFIIAEIKDASPSAIFELLAMILFLLI